jgi:hypothetical protein
VYGALGFEDTWTFRRFTLRSRGTETMPRPGPLPAGMLIAPIDHRIWQQLRAYDAAAFGADRGELLARLRGRLPAAELVALRGDRIAGFLLGRDGRTCAQLGPLVADDDAVALALLQRALAGVPAPLYIDIADTHAVVRTWLEARGFTTQRPFTRMVYRRHTGFDDPVRTYAVVGPEFG